MHRSINLVKVSGLCSSRDFIHIFESHNFYPRLHIFCLKYFLPIMLSNIIKYFSAVFRNYLLIKTYYFLIHILPLKFSSVICRFKFVSISYLIRKLRFEIKFSSCNSQKSIFLHLRTQICVRESKQLICWCQTIL